MALIVQKFGGTSVKDAERIFHVAGIIADAYRAGNDVIVVLSAQGDTTDDLVAKAQEIDPHASRREMDMLLSTGEQISVALCAMALRKMGLPVISLNAWQVGIQTTSVHSNARIKRIDSASRPAFSRGMSRSRACIYSRILRRSSHWIVHTGSISRWPLWPFWWSSAPGSSAGQVLPGFCGRVPG